MPSVLDLCHYTNYTINVSLTPISQYKTDEKKSHCEMENNYIIREQTTLYDFYTSLFESENAYYNPGILCPDRIIARHLQQL